MQRTVAFVAQGTCNTHEGVKCTWQLSNTITVPGSYDKGDINAEIMRYCENEVHDEAVMPVYNVTTTGVTLH